MSEDRQELQANSESASATVVVPSSTRLPQETLSVLSRPVWETDLENAPDLPPKRGGVYWDVGDPEPFSARNRLDRTQPSFDSKPIAPPLPSNNMAAGAVGGLANAAGSVWSSIFGLVGKGLEYDASRRSIDMQRDINTERNAIQRDLGGRSLDIQNRALDLEYTNFERNWNAASRAGLFSPAQFTNMQNTTYFRSTGTGAQLSRATLSRSGSPFS